MFRQQYLDYAALMQQLQQWATQYPQWVRLQTIGRSAEGRDLVLLVIGRDPDRVRPAVWVDGNMHASEVCGTSVALAIAEDVLAIHAGRNEAGGKPLPAPQADAIREALFYILPRISPDGAEAVLHQGRYVRSAPRDERPAQQHAHWQAEDLDGDGLLGYMRQRCDDGEMVELCDEQGTPLVPPVMVPRMPGDTGPFYRLYPEGRIVHFDGHRIPDPYFLGDNNNDFNRNFPFHWAPEPEQVGAGGYPGSAPETRAVIDFALAHPHIAIWLNLHTFGGVLIRPLGGQPDSKMHPTELDIYRQVEAWMTEHTGYACVSGFHEFLYEPEKPLHGALSEWAHGHRGCLAYVVELWDLFRQLGLERRKPFVEHYGRMDRATMRKLAQLDRDINEGRIFKPWRSFLHPQIGPVELGGFDSRIGIWNPPLSKLPETCASQSAAFLRVASLLPSIHLEVLEQESLGGGITRVRVQVRNRGYLASYGIPSAQGLPHSEALTLQVQPAPDANLQWLGQPGGAVNLGHLEGWGRGLNGGVDIFTPWTRGNSHQWRTDLLLQGSGTLELRAGSCRVGWQTLRLMV